MLKILQKLLRRLLNCLAGKRQGNSLKATCRKETREGTFTYKTGAVAMKNKAVTSLERARKFNAAIRDLIRRTGT